MQTLEWRAPRLEDLAAAQAGQPKNREVMGKYSKVAMVGLLTLGSLDGFGRGLRQPLGRAGAGRVFVAER